MTEPFRSKENPDSKVGAVPIETTTIHSDVASGTERDAMKNKVGIRISKTRASTGFARGLGWFSVGLGLAQIVAPRGLARLIGVRTNPGLMRFLGFRELASGIGILRQDRPSGWVKARVAGDAMDLALLGTAFKSEQSDVGRVALATATVAGVQR